VKTSNFTNMNDLCRRKLIRKNKHYVGGKWSTPTN